VLHGPLDRPHHVLVVAAGLLADGGDRGTVERRAEAADVLDSFEHE
jgi:hypothetical protein